jgi:ribose transport system substrate-binding protein
MSPKRKRHRRGARATAAAAAVLACVAAVGCGSSSSGGSGAGSSAGNVAIGNTGKVKDYIDISKVCGKKPVIVGSADGSQNSWRRVSLAELRDEVAKCPSIKKLIYTNAQNDTQKFVSDIQGQVAQGVDILLVFPDTGPALLPTLREAKRNGVIVIPWATTELGDGKAGVDYFDTIGSSDEYNGEVWARWFAKTLHGRGNIVFLGGTPGNPVTAAEAVGFKRVLKDYPGLKLLTPEPVVTNWDPAQEQKVMAGLLTKYPRIDGVMADYGFTAMGAIRAFLNANRPLVPFASNDANGFACLWKQYKDSNPKFEIATISGRNWIARTALRKGLAAFQGLPDQEPSIVDLDLTEDSTVGGELEPKCDPSLPPDAPLSSQLSQEQLAAVFK